MSHLSLRPKVSRKSNTSDRCRFRHCSEVERIQDALAKNVKFENAQFDFTRFSKENFFRDTNRTSWVERKGFVSSINEHSLTKTRFHESPEHKEKTAEPYQDPPVIPDFVRTTQSYLKMRDILQSKKRLEVQ